MAEYIEKEPLLRKAKGLQGSCFSSPLIVAAVETSPSIEVVLCRDCKHWGGITYGFVCRKLSGIETKICMGAEHFCSYGERKAK